MSMLVDSLVSLFFVMIGPMRLSIISISCLVSFVVLISGILGLLGSSLEDMVVKARIGLKTCVASFISCLFLIVTILGIVWSWATRFLKPSVMMVSVLSSMSLVMSFSVSLVVFVFLIVVSSCAATPIIVCAPAWACLHVSRPCVSNVKSGWWMCLAVAIL